VRGRSLETPFNRQRLWKLSPISAIVISEVLMHQ